MSKNPHNKKVSSRSSARLHRDLSLGAAISVGIGTMIGAGIFILPGIVANKAGPAVLLSFVICGFIAVLIALCMAELSTGMPYAGGGYLFVVRAFGPLVGSIIGWALWLSLMFASAFYMIGFGHYMGDVLGGSPTLIALIMIALLGLLNFIGARETGGTQTLIVGLLLFVLVTFILFAVFSIKLEYLSPFVPPEIGFQGVLITLPILFVTFLGFAEISAVSEEIRNPNRNLPVSLVGSVILVTLIYCLVVFCILGLKSYSDPSMAQETVLMQLSKELIGRGGYLLVLLGGILATVSSANASVMAASRVSFAMGRDQLLPEWFNQIHSRFRTPYCSISVTMGVTALLVLILGNHLEFLAEVAGFLSLILYLLIALASMVMRYARLDWYRPSFRTPLFPLVPLAGMSGCVFVIVNTTRMTLIVGYLIIAVSLIWYVLFMRKKKQLVGASSILLKQKLVKPLVARAEEYIAARRETFPKVLVPLANPETERSLLKISTIFAKNRGALLRLIHVISVPMQTPLEAGRQEYEDLRKEKKSLLDVASKHSSEQGVRARPSAIVAHNIPSAILGVVDMENPDLIVMGWKGEARMSSARRPNVVGVIRIAKENVVVLKDRGLQNIRRILVPVSGGPHALLGLELAFELAKEWGASLTALNVQVGKGMAASSSEFERESLNLFQDKAREFVRETLDKVNVPAEERVVLNTDIVSAIVKESLDHDLIVMGASEEWAVRRWLFGSIPDQVADRTSVSVIMVRSKEEKEKPE
ncbi:amino acid permease [bacterium]|nr:amino acid permease [bacterium]